MPYRNPTIHSMNRRAPWHDYAGKGMYMVTLTTLHRKLLFGKAVDEPHPHIDLTPVGLAILKQELKKISAVYPNVEVWKTMIMPDHIHMIMCVTERFKPKKTLSTVISSFKSGCNKLCHDLGHPMFKMGYNDKILLDLPTMEKWKVYLDDNPRRLCIKRRYPDLFTVMTDAVIAGYKCQAIGNRFLLDLPEKMAVIVHRADSDEVYAKKVSAWMRCGSRGGALVSAAISPREKTVLREAMERGYNIILIRENGFPELYKPAGRAFDACASGRLLQISPWQYHMERRTITREQCLALNRLALLITGEAPATV